jgi:hypothetical protein
MLTQHLRVDFSHCSFKAPRWFSAWSRNESGYITGILAVEFQTWFEGKITVLVLDPRCLSRRALRAIFTALFSQAKRLTAEVEPSNPRALRQVQRLGFQFEGHHPLGLEGTRDTIVFGMLKDECPWLSSNKVLPRSSLSDIRDRVSMHAVDGGEFVPRPRTGSNGSDLFVGQGSVDVSFTDVSTFDQVGLAGFPTEVPGIDASRYSTGMRGVHLAGRHTVHGDADEAVDFSASVGGSVPHLRVTPRVDGERPQQAVVARVNNSMSKKVLRGHRQSLQEG